MVFDFDHPHESTDPAVLAQMLGGKGAGLAIMRRALGLPVPPGFTIPAAQCATGMTDALMDEVVAAVARVETATGQLFGDADNPLLLSVRSGAAQSMPGMMDTILNVGLRRDASGQGGFAGDCYATFLGQFCRSVLGLDRPDVAAIDSRFGGAFLDDPWAVLRAGIAAVFASWNSDRARSYRAREGLSDVAGTAVTVQAMVFGNRNARSGTGVVFSRDPSTGEPCPTGDWLAEAQGEAVVAGTHHPQPFAELADFAPAAHAELLAMLPRLEAHYRDMVDVEFTVEDGQLWILQVRRGKRAPAAAARIACSLMDDPAIMLSPSEACAMVPADIISGAHKLFVRSGGASPIACGVPASPGLVHGKAVFDCDNAIDLADAGEAVILVRSETSPEDVHGMGVSAGILTTTGGAMSHAALVAREWGIAAVCGADIMIGDGWFEAGGQRIAAGTTISIDGRTGEVFATIVDSVAIEDDYVDQLRQRMRQMEGGEA
jgi:pyruvate, orthophosphate dikinase